MANPFAKKPASPSEVTTAVRAAIAENAAADAMIDSVPEVEVIPAAELDDRVGGGVKLSKLIEGDFPFDESQLDAIKGISEEQYACLTGAAGTGKTTTTKAIVDSLVQGGSLDAVDMEKYWAKGFKGEADDEYEAPVKLVPSVAMCSFTGRATQMIKKNFPRDWHGNIMTIHRMLGFFPEFYEDWDEEEQTMRKKVRFVPTYNADFRLPWDIIIIDEAGMLGIDLWLQLIDACKPGCRIIMIGDINQLPPVHGKSIFGYAMCDWPSWELTHVHRQQGTDNEIVDNAWRIIHGQRPESKGRFLMVPLKGDAQFSSRQVRAMIPELQKRGVFDPIRDSVITPINGEEGSRGFALGQLPLNREFAMIFNPQSEHPRYIIDGGRERKQFAVGDKVMATKNDWEAGITNGMTGIIVDIAANGEYGGEHRLFGTVDEVNKYLAENPDEAEYVEFDLESLDESMLAMEKGKEKAKEKRERGPASHIVTVRFGDDEHGFEIPFATLSEVGSLMTAYVVTCHKMQGGEAPVIVVICHDAHRAMLYREWLYTAVTRASEKCILLYKEDALRAALNKQKMPGRTLKEKVLSFNAAQNIVLDGVNMARDVRLPHSTSTRNKILERDDTGVMTPARLTTQTERTGGLAALLGKKKEQEKPQPEVIHKVEVKHTFTVKVKHVSERVNVNPSPDTQERRPTVDGGTLTPEHKSPPENPTPTPRVEETPVPQLTGDFDSDRTLVEQDIERATKLLPPPPVTVSQPWAAHYLVNLDQQIERAQRLLPHIKEVQSEPVKKVLKFGVKR